MALTVSIAATPSLPNNGLYPVGSSLSLACQAQGGYSPLSYNWNSTCSGICFALGATTSTITRSVLHSADSGIHTCTVTDYIGHTGTSMIQVGLTGSSLIN